MACCQANLCVFEPLLYTEHHCSSLLFQLGFPEKYGWLLKTWMESHCSTSVMLGILPHFCIPVRLCLCRYTRTFDSSCSYPSLHSFVNRHLTEATTHSALSSEVQEPPPPCFLLDAFSLSPWLSLLFRL